jgi:predicted dehydrogenase/threonine dehydrogenase-like Zn-dependent dehydrogenase
MRRVSVKQVLFRGGMAVVADVPAPGPERAQVLVQVAWSCVSPGTELVAAARTSVVSILERFRHDPAQLRKVFDVFHDHSLQSFSRMLQQRLTSSTPSGYSCAGIVLATGPGVGDFTPGDRVACAGSGYAHHAEAVAVPQNLVTRVPDGVDLADAATVALGAIALQGVRRAQAAVGERIGVIGLGFLGQLTVQLLKAAGCKVFGMDLDPVRVAQAKILGLDAAPDDLKPVEAARRFSEGYGLDAVLLTAATEDNEPLDLAMQMARRKGRVVVVGDVGLSIRREQMYAKELDLLISTSYGPGRYDPSYEEGGLDYPYAYVRWTENRNMQAYLELIADGGVTLAPLTVRRLPITEAAQAYRLLQEESPRPYTVLLEYPTNNGTSMARQVPIATLGPAQAGTIRLAIIGAGAFARNVHLPNLRKLADRFRIEVIVARHGATAAATAKQMRARAAGTDYREVLADSAVDAVLIATRHHLHAEMVGEALRAGKHVFIEKPLALTTEELSTLETLVDELATAPAGCPVVFVGFNRRYSPYAVRLRELVAERSTPLHLSYRMNAGYLPPEHWVHGAEGGGRVLGEACHIFDLFRFLVGAPAVKVCATGVRAARRDVSPTDNFTVTICYAEGSVCTLLYTAQGGRDLAKEAMELHCDGRSFLLDDYRRLRGFGAKVNLLTKGQEKGHREELWAFQRAIGGLLNRQALWAEAVEVTRTALEADQQVRDLWTVTPSGRSLAFAHPS